MWRWVVLCAMGWVGCKGEGVARDGGLTEVEVGGRSWSTGELDQLIAAEPELLRARFATDAGRAEFIDRLVERELLLQEARRRGVDRDPEVRTAMDRVLVQALLARLETTPPSETDLRKAYDDARAEFSRPDRLHVRAVTFATVKEAEQARATLSSANAADRDPRLAAMARSKGDAAAGELEPQPAADLETVLGVSAGALSALRQPGDLARVESKVLVLRGLQPGATQTFEAVRPRLEQRLMAERRARALEGLLTELRAKGK